MIAAPIAACAALLAAVSLLVVVTVSHKEAHGPWTQVPGNTVFVCPSGKALWQATNTNGNLTLACG
jgi:hypothetical protein